MIPQSINGEELMEEPKNNFLDHFKDLKDPLLSRSQLHGVAELIFLSLCAIVSGCNGWLAY